MMAMLSCPLCCQSCFSSVDLLRTSLISIINRPLICPICNDVQHSLDNLATHLTQHIDVPSQIGHTELNDTDNVIHNININNTTAKSESGVNHFEISIERKCNENITQKLDTLSPICIKVNDDNQPIINEKTDQIIQPSLLSSLFICNLCNCSFRTQELQQMHMQLVHEINIRTSNEECSKLANAHIISSSMLQCYLCPKRFKMIGSLRLHVRMVHGVSHVPPSQKLPAVICETGGKSSNNLVHSTGKEMGTGDLIQSTTALHVNSTNLPLGRNNQCDYYSNYSVSDVVSFGCTVDTEQNDQDTASSSNGNNNSKETITNTEDRVHKCDICNKRFTTKYFLKKHKRLHTGKCEIKNERIIMEMSIIFMI